jgi:hypothetical protein
MKGEAMKLGKLLVFALTYGLVGSLIAADKVTHRPISDFVDRQGTFCIPDGNNGCLLFVPPVANFIGWGDPQREVASSVDYAGLANKYLREASGGRVDLGTTTTGTIIERALPDGRANVSVTLHTINALSWAALTPDFPAGSPIFGVKVDGVLGGETPALARVEFRVTFTNTAPGAPLPDFIQLFFDPAPGTALGVYSFQASGSGLFCDGSRGRITVSQTGNVPKRSNIQAAIVNLGRRIPECPPA